ncbi:MAG: hypothetical protein OEW17_00060 [Gemmatimonadota bacterium]|nr:hypothetical protein [Gemmatimonadota bacterium]MDH4347172.1 hypothetical protein [Gemmatimonadota bacterium]MDH5283082.1 hypothetical protein [Gemmatimonadota bacterium]
MRRNRFVLLLAAIVACGGDSTDNNDPPSPYDIAVISQIGGPGAGGTYVTTFTLEVTLKADGSIVPGVTVVTQTTVGDVATLPLITAANGRVTGVWTIQPADQSPGASETLAYCAADPPGATFCDTKLNGPDAISVTF